MRIVPPTINQTETHMHHTVLYKICQPANYAQYSTHCRLWCLATPTCRLLVALSGESLLTFTVCILKIYVITMVFSGIYKTCWLSIAPT